MTDQALELNRTIAGGCARWSRRCASRTAVPARARSRRSSRGAGRTGSSSSTSLRSGCASATSRSGSALASSAGIIRRVALDEAHTFVQWGDDFRPSVRRAEDFLRRLKSDHPELQLLALTATANETVREGLRDGDLRSSPRRGARRFRFRRAQTRCGRSWRSTGACWPSARAARHRSPAWSSASSMRSTATRSSTA